jgi:hypothetical protein
VMPACLMSRAYFASCSRVAAPSSARRRPTNRRDLAH